MIFLVFLIHRSLVADVVQVDMLTLLVGAGAFVEFEAVLEVKDSRTTSSLSFICSFPSSFSVVYRCAFAAFSAVVLGGCLRLRPGTAGWPLTVAKFCSGLLVAVVVFAELALVVNLTSVMVRLVKVTWDFGLRHTFVRILCRSIRNAWSSRVLGRAGLSVCSFPLLFPFVAFTLSVSLSLPFGCPGLSVPFPSFGNPGILSPVGSGPPVVSVPLFVLVFLFSGGGVPQRVRPVKGVGIVFLECVQVLVCHIE